MRFDAPPAANANVTISYSRQTFTDAQLDHYLAEAGRGYSEPRQVVYRAARLTCDALLTGAATALNFGAGSERRSRVPPSTSRPPRESLRAASVAALRTRLNAAPSPNGPFYPGRYPVP